MGSVGAFIAEARRVAKLKHPGIVPIFDAAGCAVQAGQGGGSCFLASEYVAGGSRADLLRRQSVPPADAVRFVAEVAETLHDIPGRGSLTGTSAAARRSSTWG